jgi:hypothetical protein
MPLSKEHVLVIAQLAAASTDENRREIQPICIQLSVERRVSATGRPCKLAITS